MASTSHESKQKSGKLSRSAAQAELPTAERWQALRPMWPDSFSFLQGISNELESLFDAFVPTFAPQESGVMARRFIPWSEAHVEDGIFEASIEVPGFRKEDIKINAQGRLLTIEGERKRERMRHKKGVEEQSYERQVFTRSFHLPEGADLNKVTAEMDHGVLNVHIPMSQEQSTQRRIEISDVSAKH
jgi:HSP20 family protein